MVPACGGKLRRQVPGKRLQGQDITQDQGNPLLTKVPAGVQKRKSGNGIGTA